MTSTVHTTRSVLPVAALLAAAALALPIAVPAQAAEERSVLRVGFGGVSGSGKIQTDTRAVSGFQAISLKTSAKLVLRQGSREGVELRADDNILPLIETRVVDGTGGPTLEIRSRDGMSYSTRTTPVVTVDLIKLSGLSVSGSGDVIGDDLKSPALKIAISGAGDIRLNKLAVDDLGIKVTGSGDIRFNGRAGKLGIAIAGSGDVDTAGLEADDVSVSIAGSGDASVNARKTLAVTIAGSGDVIYRGDAVLKTSIAGSGTVRKK
jgi:hypothetical protein